MHSTQIYHHTNGLVGEKIAYKMNAMSLPQQHITKNADKMELQPQENMEQNIITEKIKPLYGIGGKTNVVKNHSEK